MDNITREKIFIYIDTFNNFIEEINDYEFDFEF
jgi:hypothetical protein